MKNYNQLIDDYLRGDLNLQHQQEFQSLLEQDPMLYNEYQFQKDVIEAIKHNRNLELKNYLNSIQVGTSVGFSKSTTWVAGTLLIACIGITAWLTYPWFKEAAQTNSKTPVSDNSVQSLKNTQNTDNKQVAPPIKTDKPLSSNQKESEATTSSNAPQTTMDSKQSTKIQSNTVVQESQAGQKNGSTSEVELTYQFDGQNIFLFDVVDYRVLHSVNAGEGTKNYIFIKETFYELKTTSGEQIGKLKDYEITNEAIIEKLKKLLSQ